ncbi:MAG: ATP-binding protein [Rubrivivax sp.]|nr:ATP-binding protein [Rubrivivax sp.]
MKPRAPRTLFGRLLLIMTAGLLLAQVLGVWLQLSERRNTVGSTVSLELTQRVAAVYRAIDHQRPAERAELAAWLASPRLSLELLAQAPQEQAMAARLHGLVVGLKKLLGPDVEVRALRLPRIGDFSFELFIRLSAGDWLHLRGGASDEVFAWPWLLLANLSLMLTAVIVLVWWAARQAVRPLSELAAAALALGEDLGRKPLPEDGPQEVQQAAKAFNAMQTRLRAGIEERERFLAAVSHDLRTPVTRLRLRAEMLTDPLLRERTLRDLDDMQGMLDGALDFLHGKLVDEPTQPVDMVALLESMVDDAQDAGQPVTLQVPPGPLRLNARPRALKRAISNLIDNALKYGARAGVEVAARGHELQITVDDDGPGLEAQELTRVFEPFYRVESSRSRETGGVGLGLAIVRQVARSHGGEVELLNRPEGGLRALMRLPLQG